MPDDGGALLSLQIESAILLDHVLRLKSERKPALSRMFGRLASYVAALRGSAGRARRDTRLGMDSERCTSVILKSGLFDAEYYLRRNPDVAAAGFDPVEHYLRHGAAELRDPGPHFSTAGYLRRYPGVARSGLNPLYHFVVQGYAKGLDRTAHKSIDHGSAARSSMTGPSPSRSETDRRLVVYTAVFGDYDGLFVPSPEQAERCDFVLFTDLPDIPSPWRRGAVSYATPNRFKQNRFHKLLPHRLFPEYQWSLYLDGNVDLRMDPLEFLDRHCRDGGDFLVFRHPRRTSILQELAACIELQKDDAELMVRQVAGYLDDGFQHAFALTENNIMLRRHNDPALVALSEAWWAEVRAKSHRDQLSLSYVIEKTGYQGAALFDEGRSMARHYPGVRLRPHRAQAYAYDWFDGAPV